MPVDLRLSNRGKRVHLRVSCWADLFPIREVFAAGVYEPTSSSFLPSTILDLGSHVGASVLFFKQRYPAARLLGLEPDSSRYQLLEFNVRRLPTTSIMPLAAWDSDGEVALYTFPERGWTSSLFQRDNEGVATTVEAISLDSLFKKEPGFFPDLIKFDIEGAELKVFSSFSALSRVPVFVGEFHSDLAGCPLEEFLALFDASHTVDCRELAPHRYLLQASLRQE